VAISGNLTLVRWVDDVVFHNCQVLILTTRLAPRLREILPAGYDHGAWALIGFSSFCGYPQT
jgi:hypothetical protein